MTSRLRSHPVLSSLLLILLLLVVGVALCEWRGWPFLRAPMARMLSDKLERPVVIGDRFALHLVGPLRLRTDKLSIGPPKWADGESRFFEADDVSLRLPWSTIWHLAFSRDRAMRIAALEVGGFDAVLWRHKDGRANWDFSRADAPPPKPGAEPMKLPEFDSLIVRNGRLQLDDAPSGLKLNAEATTDEGLAAGAESGLRIKGDGHYREGQFNFTVRSNGVLPLIAPEGAGLSIPITLQARTPVAKLKFEGQAQDIVHLHALNGSFAVSGQSLARVGAPFGITLPTTAPFDMEGQLSKAGELYKAEVARFEVGSSRLAGDFSFDRRPATPLLTGVLKGRNLDLADLGPAFGGTPQAAPEAPAPKRDRLLPTREFDIPALKVMNASVQVDLQQADLHTSYLEPLAPLRGHVKLQDGVLSLDDLLARTSGGELKGRLQLDGRVVEKPRWEGDLRWSGVRLERWIRMRNTHADAEQKEQKAKPSYISGALGGRTQFTGTGRSVAAMLSSLDGNVSAWITGGEVSHLLVEAAGLDIAQGLGMLVKGDSPLPMSCAVTRFTARDGELHADVGLIDTTDSTVLLSGDVSLAHEQLALEARVDPKDFSPLTLRTPIYLKGSFQEPKVRVDTKRLGVKALAAVALGVINPLAAVIPLLDTGDKSAVGCQQALVRLRGRGNALPPDAPKPKKVAAR
jgi:uncharacterized protein involved in outer membrane biogenesis